MKKLLTLSLGVLTCLSLLACGPTTSSESTHKDDSEENVPSLPFTVYYFASATSAVKSHPLLKLEAPAGGLIPKPDIVPTSEDEAFNTFIGWSHKLYAMSEDDLWDFENDRLPEYTPGLEFFMYGQWDYVETEAN